MAGRIKSLFGKNDETNEFIAPQDPEKLVTWLKRKREAGKARMPEIAMKLNLAYFLGQQWVIWDPAGRRLMRVEPSTDDPNAPVQVTANKIGEIGEHFIARLLKSSPDSSCRPITDDDDDVGAARAATRILHSELDRLDWERLMIELYFWVVPLGWGYLHPCWDPSAGSVVGTTEEDGNPTDWHKGDVICPVVPAFELSVDPNAKSMETALWAVRSVTMTREAVWEAYGVVPKADGERSIIDDVYGLFDANYNPKDEAVSNVLVHQLWMKPCRAAEKGLVVTWAGETIIEEPKPFPYEHGHLPFVEFDLLPPIGNREGRTWVTDLVPLQADYNDARSRESTIRRTLVPKIVYPVGSIHPGMISTRVEQIPYNPIGEAPKVVVPDSGYLTQYETAMNRADTEMGARAGQSDVSSGKPSSASMPAAAILALQETDDTKMAITVKLMTSGIRKVGWQILSLVRQYWLEERMVRTWSEAGTLEVDQFRGTNLAEQLDVRVDADSALPRSKSARVQLTMELLAMGAPGTPTSPFSDWRDVFRMLDQPGTDFLVEGLNVDAKQACRENDDLAQGVDREVHTWDNHLVHIAEHEKLRKGDIYEKIEKDAAAGDLDAIKAKATIDAHLENHYGFVLPQMGVPTPPGTQHQPGAAEGTALGPQPPMEEPPPEGGGQVPGAGPPSPQKQESAIRKRAGIGGPGNPGAVPGIPADQQAASMGR